LEETLIIQCAQTDADISSAFLENNTTDIDWERVFELSQRHGISQLVYRALKGHRSGIPNHILDSLRDQCETGAVRNLQYSQTLIEVYSTLDTNDIDVIPYRGPILSAVAYDDIALRRFGDLDLLVRRNDIPEIKNILGNQGFVPQYWLPSTDRLTRGQEWAYIRFNRDYRLRNTETNTLIELHWRIIDLKFPTSTTLDTVWDRRETISLSGHEISVLSPEDRLFMLCIHGSRHHWERFLWIVDVAEFLQRYSVNWERIVQWAKAQHCTRMLALGPLLAHDLFDTDVPDLIFELVAEDPKIRTLRRIHHEQLFDSKYPQQFEIEWIHTQMLHRRRDKFRFWIYWMSLPDPGEIERIPLPYSLAPLYPIIRLVWLPIFIRRRFSGMSD
jgi:hypothetical protein